MLSSTRRPIRQTPVTLYGIAGGTLNTTSTSKTSIGVFGSAFSQRGSGSNDVYNVGVRGLAANGQHNYGAWFDGGTGPVRLVASASASAPSHTAFIGTLWVTSAGVLYINTDGSTTWAKVGAQ